MAQLPIQLRRARKSDLPFISSSWLQSYRDAPAVDGCPNGVYYHDQHQLLERLLQRSVVLVAVDEQDPDQIAGWVCAEVLNGPALVLHYIYVKHAMRKFGVAKRMVATLVAAEQPAAVFYTHRTKRAASILRKRKEIIYRPSLAHVQLPLEEPSAPA